jgi:hypothetical protein
MLLLCLFGVVLFLGFFGIMLLFGLFGIMLLLGFLCILFLLGLFSVVLFLGLLGIMLLFGLLGIVFLLCLFSVMLLLLLSLILQLVLLRMLPSLFDPSPRLLFDLAPMCRTLTHLGDAIVGGGLGTHIPLSDLAPRVEVDLGLPLVLDNNSRDSREGRTAPFGWGDGFTGDFAN